MVLCRIHKVLEEELVRLAFTMEINKNDNDKRNIMYSNSLCSLSKTKENRRTKYEKEWIRDDDSFSKTHQGLNIRNKLILSVVVLMIFSQSASWDVVRSLIFCRRAVIHEGDFWSLCGCRVEFPATAVVLVSPEITWRKRVQGIVPTFLSPSMMIPNLGGPPNL